MLSYFVAQNRLDWRNILASPAVAASDRWTARLWPVRYQTRTMRTAAWFGKDFARRAARIRVSQALAEANQRLKGWNGGQDNDGHDALCDERPGRADESGCRQKYASNRHWPI
ncbi:mll3031 [Mesorhizobium japonicum MAFF 303099]|uniref:Mll3031 protein n=1 Tax=Mesorhizobium japonicum (strain LMG 29417 / CECT 9101 / MAFF 303099) TaxID=266835 RepID=Q98H50_RHILO|nr:mll3031 [Mesorhizobium japonicum MAFF 303099]